MSNMMFSVCSFRSPVPITIARIIRVAPFVNVPPSRSVLRWWCSAPVMVSVFAGIVAASAKCCDNGLGVSGAEMLFPLARLRCCCRLPRSVLTPIHKNVLPSESPGRLGTPPEWPSRPRLISWGGISCATAKTRIRDNGDVLREWGCVSNKLLIT